MVDFLGVGFQKCGTSSLANMLRRDSRFFVPEEKELHFFCGHKKEIAGNTDLYLEYFRASNEHQKLGEFTPCYITEEKYLQNIYAHNPAMKIIISTRNPIDRFTSAYVHAHQIGVISKYMTPEFIIQQEGRLIGYPWINNMVSQGFYSRYIKRLFSYFPENQVMINSLDELVSDESSVSKVMEFLLPNDSRPGISASRNLAKFPHAHARTFQRPKNLTLRKYNLTARELRPLRDEKISDGLSSSELWIQVRSRVEPLLATKYIDSNRELEKMLGKTLNW
jgi:Sulfotransferase domain